MKLLAISTSSFTATNRELYRRLNSDQIKVHLVIPSFWNFGKGLIKAEEKKNNDPDISFLESTNSHQRLYYLKNIKSVIKRFKPDVIYYEGDPGSLMSAVLGIIANKKSIKLLAVSCENLSQNPFAVSKREGLKQYFNACIKYALIKFSKRKIDTLFVINDEGLNYFNQLGYKKVIKTPLGFNEEVFNINEKSRKKIREKLNISNNTVVIAYFGRIVYEKGVHLLIEALERLNNKNWVFLIDNFSRYKNEYQTKIEIQINHSSLKSKTIFFEADHLEIAQYMNASDICVLPSIPTKKWLEQYGRVVPEAMACGNRLIISNKGAQSGFFEPNYEYKYAPENTEQLIKLLEMAIDEIKTNQFDRNQYSSTALQKFSINAQIDVFKSVLNI